MAWKIDPSLIPAAPTLEFEEGLWGAGLRQIAGIDEAGRGALAGPVYAAAVILPRDPGIRARLKGVRDSKEMLPGEREHWALEIKNEAGAWGLGYASPAEIDAYGIVPATRLAAMRALQGLPTAAEHLLIDYLTLPEVATPQTWLYKGDARSLSIAAASVLAKVARDEELKGLDQVYPDYGFAAHMGYGTPEHRRAISQLGPCELHRQTFALLSSK